MNRFLAIPTFRSMKLLHGILFAGTAWVVISLGAVWLMVLPGHEADPQVELVRWALLMAGFVVVPPMAIAYRVISSNQY